MLEVHDQKVKAGLKRDIWEFAYGGNRRLLEVRSTFRLDDRQQLMEAIGNAGVPQGAWRRQRP